ncbi:MAG: S4 domain-containing protein, partial [Burkholderiaceae bacterium]
MNSLGTKPETGSAGRTAGSIDTAVVSRMTVDADDAGRRLDNFLLRLWPGVPKSHLHRLIRSGQVRVNGKRQPAEYRLAGGDELRLPPVRDAVAATVGAAAAAGAAASAGGRARADAGAPRPSGTAATAGPASAIAPDPVQRS